MRYAYPIIISKNENDDFLAFIPDFNVGTQGNDFADVIRMSRDVIGAMGIDMLDDGEELPQPFTVDYDVEIREVSSLVDIDFDEYRYMLDMRPVRRNVTLPSWLNAAADRAGINVSAVLQAALKKELNIEE